MPKKPTVCAAKIETLYQRIGYVFKDTTLVEHALIHPRVFQGKPSSPVYERLEFLGDRVLSLVIAEMLYTHFPQSPEGELAKRLTALVRQETLIDVAKTIQLPDVLHPMKGEAEMPGAVVADSCEALIGALYLDNGLETARLFIDRFWAPLMKSTLDVPQDNKSALQEWAQSVGKSIPIYQVLNQSGPPHAPVFHIEVQLANDFKAQGQGVSKRIAEQNAAFALLQQVKDI